VEPGPYCCRDAGFHAADCLVDGKLRKIVQVAAVPAPPDLIAFGQAGKRASFSINQGGEVSVEP
jgi:hypothetical protein